MEQGVTCFQLFLMVGSHAHYAPNVPEIREVFSRIS